MGIPVEVYEVLEDALGKEPARKLVHGIEAAVEAAVTVKVTTLRDELLNRLVTKEEFYARIDALRAELRTEIQAQIHGLRTEIQAQIHGLRTEMQTQIHGLRTEMQTQIHELQERITALEERFRRLDLKMNFVLILLVLLLTVMNPTFTDLVKSMLGL